MDKHSPIGVFDSGLGGLSICRAILDALPQEHLFYFADTANTPYGNKSDRFLLQRTEQIVEFFVQQGCKAIVVACNTATVHSIAKLREQFKLPVIGVEPGIKPAGKATKTGKVGVLATQQTLESQSFAQLKLLECPDVDVIGQACPDFVSLVESGSFNDTKAQEAVFRYVQPLIAQQCDQIVLGCTHFSFLLEPISLLVANKANIVDTSIAVAKQLERRLRQNNLLNPEQNNPAMSFYSSGSLNDSRTALANCWPDKLNIARQLNIQ
ncbi:glutamate racemase [Thalassotalea litorea]|uniref:Glutamate racemase n=1 Tax=Thalassotalea litorea TaxID=2020715 RepID=A0A5R9IWC7_9GAMM|nr:glutamate racemase [Thalassotalea litorea]TLU67476.1 glutamate racemase [Thalassotalea litorea]